MPAGAVGLSYVGDRQGALGAHQIIEYVNGEPIDHWCDAHGLDVKDRLQLYLNVLAAVAHPSAISMVRRAGAA